MSSSQSRKQQVAQAKLEKKLAKEAIVLEFAWHPNALKFHGPNITTALTITETHRNALRAAGAPVPDPVQCRFLIDTGADGCVVKHEIAVKAGLKLINANSPLHGVGVDTTGKTYMGRILFAVQSKAVQGAQHQVMIDTQVMSADLQSDTLDGLIGRDVLQHFAMTYDGKTGRVSMRYYKPTAKPAVIIGP